jgi:NAD(P)-dependent dehydrogenase (short-subunit alcohol dehydrogenase family)
MSRRGGGNVVYVAHSRGEPVARAARRAALAPVVEVLAGEWSGKGVRFNGLVVGGGDLASPLALLASDDGASLNGETLTVDVP